VGVTSQHGPQGILWVGRNMAKHYRQVKSTKYGPDWVPWQMAPKPSRILFPKPLTAWETLKLRSPAPTLEFLIQKVWGGAPEFAWQVPTRCWLCWSQDHTRRTAALDPFLILLKRFTEYPLYARNREKLVIYALWTLDFSTSWKPTNLNLVEHKV
jgi:hypothetical protein